MQIYIAVFLGGGMGSLSRFMLSRIVTGNFTNINPLGTFLANLISTIVLGVVLYLVGARIHISDLTKALIIVGFCGGFSTFSTFSFEIFELLRLGNYMFAFASILVSLLLGVGVLYLLSRSIY